MARFEGGRKSKSGKKKALHTRVKGRKMSKRKPLLPKKSVRPLLPKKGVTQTSYEAGFFDFFKVFWNNNRSMKLCNLTRQVANAWEALLPKPKLSKKRILKDYSKEFKALQEESRRQQKAKEELRRKEREKMERKKIEDDSGTETEASSRSNFEDTEESIRSDKGKSTDDDDDDDSRMDEKRSHTDDESMSGKNTSNDESRSEYESDKDYQIRKNRREKRKRKGRKYKGYDEYLKKNKRYKSDSNDADENNEAGTSNETNQDPNSKQEEQEYSDKVPKDDIFFPMREEQSFDRIVRNNYDDQDEMLRKLKVYRSNTNSDIDDVKKMDSSDSFSSPLAGPKFPPQGKGSGGKLCTPTDTLHVKNLVVGIRQPELQEIFRVFLNDIVLIRVLDNKFNGEAVVAFKTVEAAEKAWSQMNGVEYKRLPLVLEFSNKEDLL